jgi:hypothetical protein
MRDMRSIAQHAPAFTKRLQHKVNISLLEISHASVHKFRAAAGSSFREVVSLEQQRPVATGRRINRRPESCRTSAHYDDVPFAWRGADFF